MFGTEECIRDEGESSEKEFVEGEEADDPACAEEEQAPAEVGEEDAHDIVVPAPMLASSSATFNA